MFFNMGKHYTILPGYAISLNFNSNFYTTTILPFFRRYKLTRTYPPLAIDLPLFRAWLNRLIASINFDHFFVIIVSDGYPLVYEVRYD